MNSPQQILSKNFPGVPIHTCAEVVGIRSGALFGVCATCEHWRPELRHKLWGRCGRVDHAMQYGAITRYPYDYPESERVRLNLWDNDGRISTYRDFGCNRYSPNDQVEARDQ